MRTLTKNQQKYMKLRYKNEIKEYVEDIIKKSVSEENLKSEELFEMFYNNEFVLVEIFNRYLNTSQQNNIIKQH